MKNKIKIKYALYVFYSNLQMLYGLYNTKARAEKAIEEIRAARAGEMMMPNTEIYEIQIEND